MNVAAKLDALLAEHQLYHSDFQMDHFITARAGGPTAYGQYKQALRELYKRYRGLKDLATQKALLEVDIAELEESTGMRFEAQRNAIKLRQKRMEMEDLLRNIADTQREFKRFFAQCVALKERVGELTEARREQLDREMWEDNIKRRCALDYLTRGGLSESSYETLACLPREDRFRLIGEVSEQNKKQLLDWFYHQQPDLPQLELNSDDSHSFTEALLEYTGGGAAERLA